MAPPPPPERLSGLVREDRAALVCLGVIVAMAAVGMVVLVIAIAVDSSGG